MRPEHGHRGKEGDAREKEQGKKKNRSHSPTWSYDPLAWLKLLEGSPAFLDADLSAAQAERTPGTGSDAWRKPGDFLFAVAAKILSANRMLVPHRPSSSPGSLSRSQARNHR
jgi:hypothetical protein